MAMLRNKRKLAAVTRETQEEHSRNGQSRNTPVLRINEEYITQVSEKIEGRITKKLSQEFNRIESRISDALSKLDEFLSNQQIQTHSKTVPGTFRNTNVENQGTNEDDSQSDPHPEAGIFHGQTTQNSGPKDCPDMVTGATGEIRHCPDMVTGATGEIRQCRDIQRRFRRDSQWPWHGDSNSRRDFLLLLWNFLRKTKEGALHKSATISQWEHHCDTWGRFCWPFSNCRRTVILPMSITTVTESQNCLSPSRQQCPPSTGNQRNLICLKI